MNSTDLYCTLSWTRPEPNRRRSGGCGCRSCAATWPGGNAAGAAYVCGDAIRGRAGRGGPDNRGGVRRHRARAAVRGEGERRRVRAAGRDGRGPDHVSRSDRALGGLHGSRAGNGQAGHGGRGGGSVLQRAAMGALGRAGRPTATGGGLVRALDVGRVGGRAGSRRPRAAVRRLERGVVAGDRTPAARHDTDRLDAAAPASARSTAGSGRFVARRRTGRGRGFPACTWV